MIKIPKDLEDSELRNYVDEHKLYVPSDLEGEQIRTYISIMNDFDKSNSMKEPGLMGSYCASGQQAYAYNMAKGLDVPRTKVESIDELWDL